MVSLFLNENKFLEPENIVEVTEITSGQAKGVNLKNQFRYKGVTILDIDWSLSKIVVKTMRVLVLGRTAGDNPKMATFWMKPTKKNNGNETSWTAHGLDFNKKSKMGYPHVHWCRGLALQHDGKSKAVDKAQTKRNTEVAHLMRGLNAEGLKWENVDQEKLKRIIDGWAPFLDPDQARVRLRQNHMMRATQTKESNVNHADENFGDTDIFAGNNTAGSNTAEYNTPTETNIPGDTAGGNEPQSAAVLRPYELSLGIALMVGYIPLR